MELVNYPILALSVCTAVVTTLRITQLPPRRLPIWELNRRVGGFALVAAASLVYSVHLVLNDLGPVKNAGTVAFHLLVVGICGSIELILHTLRRQDVDPRTIRRITWRVTLIAATLTIAWLRGFTHEPVDQLIDLRADPAVRVYGLLVHAYLLWVLSRLVITFIRHAHHRLTQRPIKAASYLLVAAGCACFAVVNAVHLSGWIYSWNVPQAALSRGAPLYFGLIVAGLILVGIGEPLADELHARRKLHVMTALWRDLRHLSDTELTGPRPRSAQVRLQRAYAETADALALLSPTGPLEPTPEAIAHAIHAGRVQAVTPEHPVSLADTLPPRASRRHDQQVMERIAAIYRHHQRARRATNA